MPGVHELVAPAAWTRIDFISDLHLHENEPANFLAWRRYLETTPADAIFILGDLFEVWVGDDAMRQSQAMASNLIARHEGVHFEDRCRRVLHHCALRQKALYFMHGNRDFLVGETFLQTSGVRGLPDPTVLVVGAQRYLLSHGDALCLADVEYQTFRAQVRSTAWQADFLARPLHERQQLARGMRAQSEARKQLGGPWIDLDPAETTRWIQAANAHHMVHGHTHEGVDHPIDSPHGPGTRHVLCDWHAEASPPHAQVLRLVRSGGLPAVVQRLPIDAAAAV
jgi:UDP-2,3-diacylglucosamine hydrolase